MTDESKTNQTNPAETNQPQHAPQKIANRYILKEVVGEGSYSIVYKGYDSEKHRKVAIKELKSQGLTKEEADEAQQLFFNEINILKNIRHPNIPAVYDFFIFEGRHYMVMMWIEGKSLLSILEKEQTLSQGEAVYYMRQIADALIYLQNDERKIIYKDIKPSNILINEDGHIWVIDFGTARLYSPKKKKDTHVLGTPGYAPPEAYTETQTDFSADIYSLGATFYHLTTGKEPFQFKFSFPSPCKFKPELTKEFSSLLLYCLKPRDMRIKNAREFKRNLEKLDSDFFEEISDEQHEENVTRFIKVLDIMFASIFIFSIVIGVLYSSDEGLFLTYLVFPVIIISVLYSYLIKKGVIINKSSFQGCLLVLILTGSLIILYYKGFDISKLPYIISLLLVLSILVSPVYVIFKIIESISRHQKKKIHLVLTWLTASYIYYVLFGLIFKVNFFVFLKDVLFK